MLYQADELNAMKVRFFPVPIQRGTHALTGANDLVVRGWSSFPPYRDPEKIVQVTDKGVLGILGIKQPGNQDKDLFIVITATARKAEPSDPGRPGRSRGRGRSVGPRPRR